MDNIPFAFRLDDIPGAKELSATMKIGMTVLSGPGSWIILIRGLVVIRARNVNTTFVVLMDERDVFSLISSSTQPRDE